MACQVAAPFNFNTECSVPNWKPEEKGVYFMKALTVRQPFAGLIETGVKKLEIRGVYTKHRGKLLICAGLRPYKKGKVLVMQGGILNEYDPQKVINGSKEDYPFGVMLCVVDLTDCRPMVQADEMDARHRFIQGAFVWQFENPRIVYNNPVKGKLGMFNVDAELVRYVML